MKDKIIELLVTLAHTSEKLKSLSEELDKIYVILGDTEFWEYLETTEKE